MSEKETDNQRLDRMTRALAAGQIPPEMAAAMPGKSKGKQVESVFRHITKVEWMRQFSIRERIAILLGCNLVVMIGVASRHNPGEIQPLILGKVTPELGPTEHMKSIVSGMLESAEQDRVDNK